MPAPLERATRAPHLALVLPRGLGARVGGLVDGLVDGPGLELGARGLGVPVLVPLPVQPVGLDLHVPLRAGRQRTPSNKFQPEYGCVFIVALFNRRGWVRPGEPSRHLRSDMLSEEQNQG